MIPLVLLVLPQLTIALGNNGFRVIQLGSTQTASFENTEGPQYVIALDRGENADQQARQQESSWESAAVPLLIFNKYLFLHWMFRSLLCDGADNRRGRPCGVFMAAVRVENSGLSRTSSDFYKQSARTRCQGPASFRCVTLIFRVIDISSAFIPATTKVLVPFID
jgi:hypothetical protein